VDNIADKIKQYGKEPALIGELIAPITGDIAGMITGKSGIISLLKADIALEQKAMSDYKDFILKGGKDQDLFDLLWDHLIDEDLHTAWFSNKVRELEQIKN
jgi:bacterioferritin